MNLDKRIILSIDVDNYEDARLLLKSVGTEIYAVKLGLEFGNAEGWAKARELGNEFGLPLFIDTKTKDIPNTVRGACRSIMKHAPAMFTIMADNTLEALQMAVLGMKEGSEKWTVPEAMIIGVTVLTSMAEESEMIYGADALTKVVEFAKSSKDAGITAIVCSPQETASVKALGGLKVINPGARPSWAAANDQKRPLTPFDAIKNGADYLVFGRPITQPPAEVGSPIEAVKLINKEIMEALAA